MFANIYSKSALQSSAVIRGLAQAIFIEHLLPAIDLAARDGSPFNMLEYSAAVYSDFTTAFAFGIQGGSNFVQDKKSRSRWLVIKKIMTETPFWTWGFPLGLSSVLIKFGIDLDNSSKINSAMEETKDMYLNMVKTAEILSDPSQLSRSENKNKNWTEPVVYERLLNQLRSSGGKPPTEPLPEPHLQLIIASDLMDQLVAGTETASWTLAYLMDELSKRPNLQSSLREELLSLSPPII
jgi:unspecific monooxygenase